ncbi:helix-turn-helix domain-containing protein [Lacticaseibacillus daqingensis]|uniref:helix-turn-helix domain-containing protein n=1 Tax=Lacticaseibacillus daqingensis TaxID=2486014 RepID=UPI0013DDBA25|nr:helix-turn-helix transcriptional regulator [Lacticaseibacillus daqingensis]
MNNQLSAIMGTRLLTVNEVAEGAGLQRNTVSRIRNKRAKNVTIPTLMKLCDFLQIPLHELIDYDPRSKRPTA